MDLEAKHDISLSMLKKYERLFKTFFEDDVS